MFTCFSCSISFRDAEDAVYARDGYDYDGYRLRVEFPRSGRGGFGGAAVVVVVVEEEEEEVVVVVGLLGVDMDLPPDVQNTE